MNDGVQALILVMSMYPSCTGVPDGFKLSGVQHHYRYDRRRKIGNVAVMNAPPSHVSIMY